MTDASVGGNSEAAKTAPNRRLQRHRAWVDPDAAIAYALATNDPNDAVLTGKAVPPLYTAALVQRGFDHASTGSIQRSAIKNVHGGVHGQHDVVYFGPIEPAQQLQWTSDTIGAKQTTAGVLVTQKIVVHDLDGHPLVEHLWSSLMLGGTIEGDLGTPLPDHTFPQAARGRPIGTYTVFAALDQGFRYAGASGDRTAHAVDDEVARKEGHPRKILQGMCTFAMCSGGIVKLAADGDPSRLVRFAGRFAAPTHPNAPLEVHLYDAGLRDDGAHVIAFEALSGGATVIKHGRADIRPA